ncbi:hypothetical protein [Micromonospora sp. CP22]|uniref:hypothetical protein n=1 Tax=Micromonospora sp. CP22 TaxID=2580517 RepID=UPI0012BCF8D7|nr:hypothetical protein [Micromonospora sp. CP22]MTK00822.1 hypothetical protein [Micromonospora sp. CP22]
MAHRTSSRLLFTAFGLSLLAGAGQLGLAFGFGIVRLTGTFTGASINQWPAQLVWACWFATNAAVIGAVLTERLARHGGQLTGTTRQVAVAAGSALGATVVAPLCMQPARSAELISVDPVWAVAICAGLGAVVGAGAALAVLVRPPMAWNMAAVAAVVWLLALCSVLPSLGASGPLTPVRLGVLEPAWLAADTAQRLALLILPLVTLLAGAATAAVARWRGHPPLVSGPSGVAGPVLVAFAYLAAGPGDSGDRYQLTPYYGALIAVLVGALGSAAVALLPATVTARFGHRVTPTSSTAIEPTAILQPLPTSPALPSSASAATDDSGTPADASVSPAGSTGASVSPAGAIVSGTAIGRTTGETRTADGPQAVPSDGSPPHWHWPIASTAPSATTTPTTTTTAATITPTTATTAASTGPSTSDADTHSPAAVTAAPQAAAAADTADVEHPREVDVPFVDTEATGDEPTDGTDTERDQAGTRAQHDQADDRTEHGQTNDHAQHGQADSRAERGRTDDGAERAGDLAARTDAHDAQGPAGSTVGGQSAAETDGQPGPAIDPTPVGDGSDLPRPTPATMESGTPAGRTPTPRRARKPRTPDPSAVPPPAAPPIGEPTDEADRETAKPVVPEVTPRPRQRFVLPDLGRAKPRPEAPTSEPVAATSEPGAPVPLGISAALPETPEVSIEPAATARDLTAAFTKPPAVRAEDVQPDGEPEKGRRGLFRRGRPRSGEHAATEDDEPLPAQDEEYVDWVAGLSRPLDDDEPTPPKGPRRSLRSTGRHHRR